MMVFGKDKLPKQNNNLNTCHKSKTVNFPQRPTIQPYNKTTNSKVTI
ncbi:MAG: hypothetical protein ACI85Q_001353 [Salibacteraceae bacterium]|jgi:hypothetical protein